MEAAKHLVIGLGELLWDMLPEGKKMGGAPANFSYHINNAGCSGLVISSVGDDSNGRELVDTLSSRGLNPGFIQVDRDYPTGTVSIEVDKHGNPDYIIHKDVAWDNLSFTDCIKDILPRADAICFGSLAQRNSKSYKTIVKWLENVKKECLKVFDINLRQEFYSSDKIIESLYMADVLKINEDEIRLVADILNIRKDEPETLNELAERFKLSLIALTKGADSSMLYSAGEISTIKTPLVDVIDTVGAGDSFTAVLVAGILNGDELRSIHSKAVDVSAWVCTRSGATPEYDNSIKNILSSYYR